MRDEIQERIERLPKALAPIRELALRHLSAGYAIDPKSDALLIDHRPNLGSEAYVIVLYPGISDSELDRYCASQARIDRPIEIPDDYRAILSHLNGAQILQADLFGVPKSMLDDPPLLDRSSRQPFDLGFSSKDLQDSHKAKSGFYFGAGPYSYMENLGYLHNHNGRIETYAERGQRVDSYLNFEEFFTHEINRLEALYPEYEQRQEKFMQELATKQQAPRKTN